MNIYRKLRLLFSNFFKKIIIGEINFCKKSRKKDGKSTQVSTIKSKERKHLKWKYWKWNGNTGYVGKIKNAVFIEWETLSNTAAADFAFNFHAVNSWEGQSDAVVRLRLCMRLTIWCSYTWVPLTFSSQNVRQRGIVVGCW